MALTRWTWLTLAGLSMALAVAVVLPPRTAAFSVYDGRVFWDTDDGQPQKVHRRAVENTRRSLERRIDAVRAADSIVNLASRPGAMRTTDGAITLLYGAPLTSDTARMWLRRIENELDAIPGTVRGRVPIVVALDVGAHVARSGPDDVWNIRRQLREQADRTWCVVEVRLRKDWRMLLSADRATGARSNVLNVCALYSRYGVPGPAIGRWARGRSLLDVRQYGYYGPSSLADLVKMSRSLRRPQPIPMPYYYHLAACIKGGERYCASIVGLSDSARDAGDQGDEWSWYYRGAPPTRLAFLSYLLVTESPQRFQALWSSTEPSAQAFQSAYARSAASLVHQWAVRDYVVPLEVEGTDREMLATTPLWLALLLGVGVFAAVRRQVEN